MNAPTFTAIGLLSFIQIGRAADPLDIWIRSKPSPTSNRLNGVAYANGQFVAVGDSGVIFASSDGANWEQRQSAATGSLYAISHGNGQFVAVGNEQNLGTDTGVVFTSADGITWVQRQVASTRGLTGVAYGNGQFVAVGFGDIITSTDGVNWSQRQSRREVGLLNIVYANGQWVAVGGNVGGLIITSTNGIDWTAQTGTLEYLTGITYGNGWFLAAGVMDGIVASRDGAAWGHVTSAPGALRDVTFGGGQFVAAGQEGVIGTSTDSTNWVMRQSGTSNELFGVAYGNGHFVAVGDKGVILESGSIITLALTPKVGANVLTLLLTGPAGLAYTIQSSPDLVSWQTVTNIISSQETTAIFDAPWAAFSQVFYRAYSR